MKLFAAALFLFCSLAVADDAAVKKFRNFTPDQVKNLPKKVLDSELPVMYSIAAGRGLAKGIETVFAMELNSLMYPGIGNYELAVKQFQKDLGDPDTGVLTVWQIHQLQQRSEKQKLARVLFPTQFTSYKNDISAGVTGTLTLLDENIAWPINQATLKCYKKDAYCEFDQISLAVPNETSWAQNYQVMKHGREIFTITRWAGDVIDANQNSDNDCRILSLNLNFKTKEFYYNTRNGTGDCSFMGKAVPKLSKPRVAQFVEGEKIMNNEFGKIKKAAYESLASNFRSKIDQMIAEDAKK